MLRTDLIRPLPEIVVEHAATRGDKVAFADARRRVTYAELAARTGRIAGHLAELLVQPGDRAAIYLGNCVEMVETYLAIVRANAVGVPLNPQSTDAELEYFLADSGARAVITDPAHADQVRRARGDGPLPKIIVTGEPRPGAGVVSFEQLAVTEPKQPARDDLELDEVAWMLYTSGTTGRPKGVLSTQRNGLWSVAACYVPIPGLSPQDRVLWPLPLFHSLSHIACVLSVTAVGATARIIDGLSAEEVLEALAEERSTFLGGVPTLYHYLVQAAHQRGFDAPQLRAALVGGAVTTASLRSSFEDTFGVPLLDAYGCTETSGSITINSPDGARVDGSCGLPVPGLDVRLVDPETGQDVVGAEEGEVWVRGPSVMVGYHNRPEETAAVLRDGWYHTGDLARRDDAGFFTISGRIKDLIIRGGENIHPGEVEAVLRELPGVADVAVAGKPDEILGEVPVAYLVLGQEPLDTEALFARCRERLAYFKVPEALYEVIRIPRTRSGKVTRHRLLDEPARLLAVGGDRYDVLFRSRWEPVAASGTGEACSVQEAGADRVVVPTEHAVVAREGEDVDLAQAVVAGLALAEHGDHLVLDSDAPVDEVTTALTLAPARNWLAIRDGQVLEPMLERMPRAVGGQGWDPAATVVLIGAQTPLGAVLARHLVAAHGVRDLVLVAEHSAAEVVLADLAAELGDPATIWSTSDRDLAAALARTKKPGERGGARRGRPAGIGPGRHRTVCGAGRTGRHLSARVRGGHVDRRRGRRPGGFRLLRCLRPAAPGHRCPLAVADRGAVGGAAGKSPAGRGGHAQSSRPD